MTHQITARLSDEGHEGLAAYCDAHGVTATAFIDALGQWLLDLQDGSEPANARALRSLVRVTEHARAIDTDRRSRKLQTAAVPRVIGATAAFAVVVSVLIQAL